MKHIMKWIGYVFALLLLGYVAILYNSVALLFVVVVLALLPPLELLLLAIQSHWLMISITQGAEEVTRGTACHLWLTVTNQTSFPLLLLSLTFMEQDSRNQQEVAVTLNAKESRQYEIPFVMECCGIKRICLQQGWFQDYMGWFQFPFLKSLEECSVTVYPKEQVKLPTLKAVMQGQDTQDEAESMKRGQEKDQFLGVRPYATGDSLKHIHWKMSAKQDDLYVREYSEDIRAMYLILIDADALKSFSVDEQEHAYDDIMTLGCSLLEEGCSHYIAIIYEERQNAVPVIRRYLITRRQEIRTCLYALYECIGKPEGIRQLKATKRTKSLTKQQRLTIYNQHYPPFSSECVSCIPD